MKKYFLYNIFEAYISFQQIAKKCLKFQKFGLKLDSQEFSFNFIRSDFIF
jgi:hypothetical protein